MEAIKVGRHTFGLLALTLAVFLGTGCGAGGENINDFIKRRVGVMNQHDRDGYYSMLHPEVRARINETNRSFVENLMKKDFSRQIPSNYKATLEKLEYGDTLSVEGYSTFPLHPTHVITVTYSLGSGMMAELIWPATKKEGRWYLIIPIPDKK